MDHYNAVSFQIDIEPRDGPDMGDFDVEPADIAKGEEVFPDRPCRGRVKICNHEAAKPSFSRFQSNRPQPE